jgi:N6-adenosine-specific RNA methylase IME4
VDTHRERTTKKDEYMTGSISDANHGDAQRVPHPALRESIEDSARVIVADPPWSFSDRLPGASRGAERNYKVMPLAGIEAFLRGLIASGGARVAADAVLFCWRVASQVEEAYRVVRAWGFLPKSEIVWRKLTKNGKPHFGMGRIVRASHEVCVVATRGKPIPKVLNVRSVFEAPVGRRSEKPEMFYDLIEKLFDGPYLELFARRCRPGWTCLGDEASSSGATSNVCPGTR